MKNSVNNQPHQQSTPIPELLRCANVAIVGGGKFCRKLIKFYREYDLSPQKPAILGVADINAEAEGLSYAAQQGIFTTQDFKELYLIEGLQIILEITHDPSLPATIRKTKPADVMLLDHFHSRYLWDSLQVENLQRSVLGQFEQNRNDPAALDKLFEKCFSCFNNIITRRNDRSREIELELLEKERAQTQIIQGSTIPTFVIDENHIVTHWNKALEKLTGYSEKELVGTNFQWAPFYTTERPTMADVILDQIDRADIQKLYGSHWRTSGLIEGAYEAEVFLPAVGDDGKWLWFTAAPLKAPDGTIVGAIETLWDKTEDVKAQQERERHTRELVGLCSIYTALSAPRHIDRRIESAMREVFRYLKADDVAIYLEGNAETLYLKYRLGLSKNDGSIGHQDIIHQVAHSGEMLLIDSIELQSMPSLEKFSDDGFRSLAFIPISAKEKKAFGVLQVSGKQPGQFADFKRHALDMIGNRIGVAIENAMLQEQYIKSEEKYRSLFDNDPNPIFIVDHESFEILDINERAQECYGYTRAEMAGMPFLRLGEPDDREIEYGLRNLAVGQSILLAKRKHFRKGGRSFYVNISVSHARYGESKVLIATTTDVTEAIEKETQLIQASKMTTLGIMAAGMAHEINQPLNVIQICADFFMKTVKKGQPISAEDLQAISKDITDNVSRATGIIKHVRHFARQSEIMTSNVNINDPINDVFKVLGHRVKVHQIALDLNLGDDIPYIMADHNRLEQVFINLVTNAIDAMDEKAAQPEHKGMAKQLRIGTHSDGKRVIVTVEDNGVGMSKEVKNKILEPFFTTKEVGKGTGLGVSISYGIIKDYQGEIQIDSQVGKGTTFRLNFPVAQDPN
jgi:PAS domain S-box-containing protein